MEVKIKDQDKLVDATIEMVDGVMVVSPIEKFVPKDGDIIHCKNSACEYIALFKGLTADNESFYRYAMLVNGELKANVGDFDFSDYRNPRPATEEEKKLLFDKIDKEGYEWLADKRELVKKKWKPKNGDFFYFPFFSDGFDKFKVGSKVFICGSLSSFDKGWHFKTEEECQQFCNRLNQAINSIKP